MAFIDPSYSLFTRQIEGGEDGERRGGEQSVKIECRGGEWCVNAGGPYRSESAGRASTGQQMRTDYIAVKRHMKGNTGQTGSLLNTVECLMC